MAKKKKNKYSKAKAKQRITSMDTNEVSIVNAGANGYSKWILAKNADSESTEESKVERCKKYGIEVVENSNDSFPDDGPTAESMFGDPVGLRFPLGKKDNSLDADVIKASIDDFKSSASEYKEKLSKTRIYTKIVRAALSKKIDISYNPEDDVDKLLPKEVSDLLVKSDNTDANTQDESTDDTHDDTDANSVASWLDNLKKAAAQAAFVQNINAAIQSVSTPAAEEVSELEKDVGSTEEDDEKENQQVKKLTKANEKKEESLRLLKLELTKAKAENARLSTTLTKSSSKSIGTVINKVEDGPTYNPLDLSPPLESN